MKKKIVLSLLSLVFIALCALGFAACGTDAGNNDGSGGGGGGGETPPAKYTVTYDANGGTFDGESLTYSIEVDAGSKLTAPSSPSRANMQFNGWTAEKNGNTLWNFATDTVTKNITLYAVWEEQSAVIYSVDGAAIDGEKMTVFMLVDRDIGSVSLSNKVVCSSDSLWKLYYDKLGQTEIPTKIAVGTSGELNAGDNVFYIVVTSSDSSQVNVYELTVHRSYSVNINYHGVKGALINSVAVDSGYQTTANYVPEIDGYTFNFWQDGNGERVTEFTPYVSADLYANVTAKTYNATLDVNGGNALSKTEYTQTYDAEFSFAVPTRTGYSFTGWYNEDTLIAGADGKGLESWNFISNLQLKAGWRANAYSLMLYKSTDSSNSAGTVEGAGTYYYDSEVTISSTTNAGYVWVGWFGEFNTFVSKEPSYTFIMEKNVTYYAKWIANPIVLQKNVDNAGTLEYDGQPVAGSECTVMAQTTSQYFDWAGWYNGEELLTVELSYTFVMPAASTPTVEYTAVWTANSKIFIMNSDRTEVQGIYERVPEIVIPEGVTSIGKKAFYNCGNLKKVVFPESLTNIGESAFSYCVSIPEIVLPSNLIYINDWAFNYCISLKNVTIQNGVQYIGSNAFSTCYELTSVTIPGSVKVLYSYAFSGCTKLAEVTLNEGLEEISMYAFEMCSELVEITIPDSVTIIDQDAFIRCSKLESISVNCDYIYKETFRECSALVSVTIGDNVEGIGEYAFSLCRSLKSVIIGRGVTAIGMRAFDASALETVYYRGTAEEWRQVEIADDMSQTHNWEIKKAKIYYYSETEPTGTGNYWHFADDGVTPVIWLKDE